MKSFCVAALVVVMCSACSGESLGGLEAVSLELTAVDGRALPAPAGNTQGGAAILAISGELVGQPSGLDCTYLIRFRPGAGGNVAEVNGTISPQPCTTEEGGVQNVTLSFNRQDLPSGSHTYRFE